MLIKLESRTLPITRDMIAENEVGQRQMNCSSSLYPDDPMDSSSTHYDSPLRAFLHSIRSSTEPKGIVENSISSFDLQLPAPTPFPGSRNKISVHEEDRNAANLEDDNQSTLSFMRGNSNHRNTLSEVLSAGNESTVFIQENCNQRQSLMHISRNTLQKEFLLNVSPAPVMTSRQTPKRRQKKEHLNVQSKKEAKQSLIRSYYTLNKLMERTARSRCPLLQQTKTKYRSVSNAISLQPIEAQAKRLVELDRYVFVVMAIVGMHT